MTDLVLTEEDEVGQLDYLQVIENQINLIGAVIDYPDEIYDRMAEDKIIVLAQAFQIIIQTQKALIGSI